VSNVYPAHVRYPDIPSENRKSAVVERHLKQASTKVINQNRRRSMSDELEHDRRKSLKVGKSRPIDSTITVPRFDGSGDLELFLKRFKSVAQYYCRTESETLFRLEHVISDNAQYVLLLILQQVYISSLTFSGQGLGLIATNAEHFRPELSHLRRGSLSIKDLHLEVRRLFNIAFPDKWSTSTEIYARDAFLSAPNDAELNEETCIDDRSTT